VQKLERTKNRKRRGCGEKSNHSQVNLQEGEGANRKTERNRMSRQIADSEKRYCKETKKKEKRGEANTIRTEERRLSWERVKRRIRRRRRNTRQESVPQQNGHYRRTQATEVGRSEKRKHSARDRKEISERVGGEGHLLEGTAKITKSGNERSHHLEVSLQGRGKIRDFGATGRDGREKKAPFAV